MTATLTAPAHVWVPEFTHTNGDIAAQVGEELGLPPDPDQRAILDAMFAYRVDRPDIPVCFSTTTISPRQNIKTSTAEIAALTDLFVFREPLHDWTAHLYDTASKTFTHMVGLIESNDDYRRLCRSPYLGKGDQAIQLLTGERIEFHSRSKGSGRGSTVPKRTLDEALFLKPSHMGSGLPTLATYRGAQIRYLSSSGLIESEILRGIRDRGRAGGDPRRAYFEWSTEPGPCESDNCTHIVGSVGCILDDRSMWARANPAYGRRIAEETLEALRGEMPPAEFAREFLGWWDDPPDGGGLFSSELWDSLADPDSEVPGQPSFALDVTPDRSSSVIVVSGLRADGHVHGAVVEQRPGTSWVVESCKGLPGRVRVLAGSAAASLVDGLERAGVGVEVVPTVGYVASCGVLYDLIVSSGLRHRPDMSLTAAVLAVRKKPAGDAWKWSREGFVDISPLVALTLAVQAHPAGSGRVIALA